MGSPTQQQRYKMQSDDFALNAVERDVIARHMFPLNLTPPRYRESILVCIADKICAVYETFSIPIPKHVLLAE